VPVILEYLADQAPAARLLPKLGTLERYRVKEWLDFTCAQLHKGFDPLWVGPMPHKARQLAVSHLQRRFGYLDECLRERPYLAGEHFTVADAYCFTVLRWTRFHRIDLSAHPAVTDFMARVSARPRVKQALQAEGLAAQV
jgi:glutathione S-transferase